MPIDDATLQRLGSRLRQLRVDADQTQAQVAQAVGLTRTHLVDIEAGRKNITLKTLYALAHHYGTEPADLLQDSTAAK